MNTITLYKNNLIDQKYEMPIPEFIEKFREAEKEKVHLKHVPVIRGFMIFIGVDLESTPDNVPLSDEEVNALLAEYNKQGQG